jgi:hypothetical protein
MVYVKGHGQLIQGGPTFMKTENNPTSQCSSLGNLIGIKKMQHLGVMKSQA